ncbi:MAG: hypothetical protein GX178_07785 [Acidobacteria bacterium]|nr:hypothetical protein [Acidobacteriota bacterium]
MNGPLIPASPPPETPSLTRLELELTAESHPGLAILVGGYLHEDHAREYGSAAAAAWAFCRDAEFDELADATRGWELLELLGRERGCAAAARLLVERFGSGWQPQAPGDLERVGAELRRALEGWDE